MPFGRIAGHLLVPAFVDDVLLEFVDHIFEVLVTAESTTRLRFHGLGRYP